MNWYALNSAALSERRSSSQCFSHRSHLIRRFICLVSDCKKQVCIPHVYVYGCISVSIKITCFLLYLLNSNTLIFVMSSMEVNSSSAALWITLFLTSFLVLTEVCLKYLILLRNCFRDGRSHCFFCLIC